MKRFLPLICFASIQLQCFAQVILPEPVLENRPFLRWMWHGSAVDEVGLTWNLEKFAQAGIGGVEITPIYGVKNNESNDVDYLSPKWMSLYTHTVKEGERLGVQIDMNNGTGWPFGGPHVTPDYSAKKFISDKFTVHAGESINKSLALDDEKQKNTAAIQCVVAVTKSGRKDITSYVRGKEKNADSLYYAKSSFLEFTSEEDAEIYVLYSGHTFQYVKRAAPGGVGLVLNHYNRKSLDHYLARFDDAFAASSAPWPNSFFNDSYEVYGSNWAADMLNEFYQEHGYRMELYLPEFLGEGDSDTSARVVTDYRQTLARLLETNFIIPWTEWAHSHGAKTRNQAHGSPANIIDLYAAVDIPECETYGRSVFDIPGLRQDPIRKRNDGDPAALKFASSAAHLTGKKYTSAEALTWLAEHFRVSLSQCKPEIDQMFASGVNHVVFQGAAYSPKDIAFPGWLFYATINMSPTNNIWNHAPAFFDYVTRCQTFLTDGIPDNDVLLYLPLYDIWHEQQEQPYLIFTIHKMHKTMPMVKEAMNTIVRSGYDADYISDRFIGTLKVKGDKLISEGGAEYKALVIPSCHKMPLPTLERLCELAEKGAKIIFVDNIPDDVPGFANLDARRNEMKKLLQRLEGKVTIGNDYATLLAQAGACQEIFKSQHGGTLLRQKNKQGGYDYFISMLRDNPINGYVKLGAKFSKNKNWTVYVCDPLDGFWRKARYCLDGENLSVYLNLDPGASLLVRTIPQKCKDKSIEESIVASPYKKGQEIVINSGWNLSFPKSDPVICDTFYIDTLKGWDRIDDERLKINCATGLYRTEFKTPSDSAQDWILDLGDVRESAKVRLNGKVVGTAFCAPFRFIIKKDLLAPEGQLNIIEIEVCNLPSNRIADLERKGIEWKIFKDTNITSVTGKRQFSFVSWPTDPSGLNSEVKLIPIYRNSEEMN